MKTFTLEDTELEAFEKWDTEHECDFRYYNTAIGGRVTYSFTNTGVGTAIIVKCACGASENITDYSLW